MSRWAFVRWVDYLLAGLAIVLAGLGVLGMVRADQPGEGALSLILAVGAIVGGVLHARSRWELWARVAYVTRHGVMVWREHGVYEAPPGQIVLEDLLDDIVGRWAALCGRVAIGDAPERALQGLTLAFREEPFMAPGLSFPLAGAYWPGERRAEVMWRAGCRLADSALAHEVGHAVYCTWRPDVAGSEFEAFWRKNSVALDT